MEPPDSIERENLLRSAELRIRDAQRGSLSLESKFDLAYNAAHAAALAALRAHGYRSESRFLVFQCLEHTVGLAPANWRLFDLAHKKRNLAEYEGFLDITAGFVDELIQQSVLLIALARSLSA